MQVVIILVNSWQTMVCTRCKTIPQKYLYIIIQNKLETVRQLTGFVTYYKWYKLVLSYITNYIEFKRASLIIYKIKVN